MASEPSGHWISLSITHLASSQTPNQPTSFSDEPKTKRPDLPVRASCSPKLRGDHGCPGRPDYGLSKSKRSGGEYLIGTVYRLVKDHLSGPRRRWTCNRRTPRIECPVA